MLRTSVSRKERTMPTNYYQKDIETMPRGQIRALQEEKLKKQVKHVYEHVPYYRDLMDKKGVKPEDIKTLDDIQKLPFISKYDLRETYPYGMLAVPLKDCVRIQSTSGTTGKRVIAYYTQHDVDLWEECWRPRTQRRFPQAGISYAAHVQRKHGQADTVHTGS